MLAGSQGRRSQSGWEKATARRSSDASTDGFAALCALRSVVDLRQGRSRGGAPCDVTR